MFRSFLEKIVRLPAPPRRETGLPPSGNGASSFHLYWDVPPVPLAEVSVTIEVVEPPRVNRLYFWAVQASFERDGSRVAGAHLGLQHHPRYPDAGAVNWGGYHQGGGILDGSVSELPSAPDDINTRDYPWQPGRPYRYRIFRSPERGWRGTVADLTTGETTVVRDLWIEADTLVSPMMWTEAFCDCGDPPAAVRWSDMEAVTQAGERHDVSTVRVNYQRYADGGCTNTDVALDDHGRGLVQRTGTPRITDTGATLRLARG